MRKSWCQLKSLHARAATLTVTRPRDKQDARISGDCKSLQLLITYSFDADLLNLIYFTPSSFIYLFCVVCEVFCHKNWTKAVQFFRRVKRTVPTWASWFATPREREQTWARVCCKGCQSLWRSALPSQTFSPTSHNERFFLLLCVRHLWLVGLAKVRQRQLSCSASLRTVVGLDEVWSFLPPLSILSLWKV